MNKGWKNFDFGSDAQPKVKTVKSRGSPIKKNVNKKYEVPHTNTTTIKRKHFNFDREIAPKIVLDLAVHPKKIKEVETWLQFSTCPKNNNHNTSFLLISGPTGSGKTATVNVLCDNLGVSVIEWVNPMDQDYELIKGPNQVNRFIEFLTETKYTSLFEVEVQKKVVIVKDFPNTVVRNPEEFSRVLDECFYKSRCPIIFICTDSSSSGMNLSQSLFPQELKEKYSIDQIVFNSCAPTLMKNAIKRAISTVQAHPDIFKTISNQIIEAILASSMGDIRSAMNQFHLASLVGSHELPTNQVKLEKSGTKRKRDEKQRKVKNMERDELLGMFHGLGRVLNPKRTVVGDTWKINCNFEKLVDEFSTMPGIFTSFLFENYVQYFGDLNDASHAAEILSISQIFLEKWQERHETLVFALWVSVMGLMIHNEHRISKWTQIRGPTKIIKSSVLKDGSHLSSTDFYYYNIIKKCDKYPQLNFE